MLDISDLSPQTLRLLQDARYRAGLTATLIQSDPSSAESVLATETIDAAVVQILAAARLPRGPINGPVIEHVERAWFGRKAPDCTLFIDVAALALLREEDRPDSLIRTWLHESLHARQPYSTGYLREWKEARGYEEGMVEGLTRLIAVDRLGLRPVVASYDFYVAAYRALASALSVDVGELWSTLWGFPAGEVSAGLMLAVERILREDGRSVWGSVQRSRFILVSARHFSSGRANDRPNEQLLVSAWRHAIE